MPERIGFVSTRFSGNDGVSLESAKWAELLWDYEHISFWYGGLLDRAKSISLCVPEAHFAHPENIWINERLWGVSHRTAKVTRRINAVADYLKDTLYEFVKRFDLSILILENALTIPMHVPLGLAITEFMNETRIPCIAHHHDFYWERTRFLVNAASEYLEMAFPARHKDLQHVVINQTAQEELSWRKGVSSLLVPNVFDFENPPPRNDGYAKDFKAEIGLKPDDVMILQPTRVVARKGIEHAIKLVEMLGDPKYKLVISHASGDEGFEYEKTLRELAADANVDIRFVSTRISEKRQIDSEGRKIYTLWDLYPHADLVTYPSLYEGFGNAFLEAIYFGIPILINRYSIFARDIEPLGFRMPVMDGFVSQTVVDKVRHLLEDEAYRKGIIANDRAIATRYYSYSVLRRKLRTLITNITGLEKL